MDLLNIEEIKKIVVQYGAYEVLDWTIENYSEKLLGYLGDHLKLIIKVQSAKVISKLYFFIKCMPRHDKWKAEYLRELTFFKKEYIMLSDIFEEFGGNEGTRQWRPKLLYIKEELFVFQDVSQIGYKMPDNRKTMSHDEIIATVEAIARFHAQSYVLEEKKSRELKRPYRIWQDYNEYLQESMRGLDWRNTGRDAAIAFLKVHSKYKFVGNFSKALDRVVPCLFDTAIELMKPSAQYRNAIVHRDLWSNNIFLKEQNDGKLHALIVDFQTVLYCSPMLDLTSVIYFNTTRKYREKKLNSILERYYEILSEELMLEDIDVNTVFRKDSLVSAYTESIVFGLTQAAIIVPIISMSNEKRQELFSDPDTCEKINTVSRSEEFLQVADEDPEYCFRVMDLLDEIVERYVDLSENK